MTLVLAGMLSCPHCEGTGRQLQQNVCERCGGLGAIPATLALDEPSQAALLAFVQQPPAPPIVPVVSVPPQSFAAPAGVQLGPLVAPD